MDSQMVRYILIILVNVLVLGVYINDYSKWHPKLVELPWSIRRLLSTTCRMLGLVLIISNYFVYIVGSYALLNKASTVADGIFFYMVFTIVLSSFGLTVSNEGFKRETQIVRVRKDEERW